MPCWPWLRGWIRSHLKVLVSASEKAGAAKEADVQHVLEQFQKEYGIDVRRFLSAVGDTWCAYNSPAEGEMIFFGWTAVVSVRDRAALVDCWEQISAAQEKKARRMMQKARTKRIPKIRVTSRSNSQVPLCRARDLLCGRAVIRTGVLHHRPRNGDDAQHAGHEGLPGAEGPSLAGRVPGVARALNDPNRPAALGYCDTPRVFELLYPLVSLYAA